MSVVSEGLLPHRLTAMLAAGVSDTHPFTITRVGHICDSNGCFQESDGYNNEPLIGDQLASIGDQLASIDGIATDVLPDVAAARRCLRGIRCGREGGGCIGARSG